MYAERGPHELNYYALMRNHFDAKPLEFILQYACAYSVYVLKLQRIAEVSS